MAVQVNASTVVLNKYGEVGPPIPRGRDLADYLIELREAAEKILRLYDDSRECRQLVARGYQVSLARLWPAAFDAVEECRVVSINWRGART